ncbi:MAG: hypothetical protein Q9204_002602 [Flavoplaca sp. TL-2023a]
MSFEELRLALGATFLGDSPRWGIYNESFNKFRSASYRDPDPNLQVAADIVAYIRHRYLHQLPVTPAVDATRVHEEPGGSALSPGSAALQPYLTDLEKEEFLADLFDSEENPLDGSVFHEQCEVIWHKFPSPAGRNPTSGPTFLWVRAEYLIYYLLISRLREDKSVLMHVPGRGLMIFCHSTGIYMVPLNDSEDKPKNYEAFQLPKFADHFEDLWVLLDANDYEVEIPRWSYEIPGAKVIYTSSPNHSRWKKLRQEEYYPRVLIMNPYTRNEALLLAILEAEARPLKIPSDLPRSAERKLELCATALKFFEQNPGPRCFIVNAWTEEDPDSKLNDLEQESRNVIISCPKERLVQLFSSESNATSKDNSHTIVCVYRDPSHNDYYRTNRSFVRGTIRLLNTKIIKSLSTRLESLLREERRGFFKLVCASPETRPLAGLIFQGQLMQLWERDGIRLVVHDKEVNANPNSVIFQFTSPSTKLDIDVSEVIFDYNLPKRLDYSVLFYPENPRFPAIDFLIRDKNNHYYGIQVTLGTTHKIVPKLHDILTERGVTDSQYTHIFVQGRGGYQDGNKDKFTVPNDWHQGFGFKVQVAWVDCPLDPLI